MLRNAKKKTKKCSNFKYRLQLTECIKNNNKMKETIGSYFKSIDILFKLGFNFILSTGCLI